MTVASVPKKITAILIFGPIAEDDFVESNVSLNTQKCLCTHRCVYFLFDKMVMYLFMYDCHKMINVIPIHNYIFGI